LLPLLTVFLSGLIVGALGVHRLVHQPPPQPSWKESGKEIALEHLKKELDLTPAQTEQLETILDDFFTYYHSLQAQLDDVRALGRQRIMRLLNEEQRRKFEKLSSQRQARQLH
jgi:hypothetical protein